MPSSPIDVLACHLEHVTIADPLTDLLDLPALAEVMDSVPDSRRRRYRLGPLLALSLLAVLGGATSLAKITHIIAGYDPHLRAQAGLPGTPRPASALWDGSSPAWTATPSTPPPAATGKRVMHFSHIETNRRLSLL
ncbi:hypothetical protein [Nonomuraea sp. NPDC049141]|uniref:hypothetical protein n=1 Tax=Nonomuraea sp. NPDC049141 TaxID=3155500 RepID=UPI0033CCC422